MRSCILKSQATRAQKKPKTKRSWISLNLADLTLDLVVIASGRLEHAELELQAREQEF